LHILLTLQQINGVSITTASVLMQLICTGCLQCFDAVGWAAGRASGL